MSDKVEKVSGGEPREFSAIKGQGKASKAPTAPHYEDKEAIAKLKVKNDCNKGE